MAVVSRRFASLAWPGQDPLGRRVRLNPRDSTARWRTMVGVVADTRYRDIAVAAPPGLYVPLRQTEGPAFVAVRTDGDPARALATVRRALQEVDPGYGIRRVDTGRALLAVPLTRPRLLAATLAGLSTVSLVLAAVGLFGVLSAFVRQRARELGVRLALGATPAQVGWLVLGQAARVVGAGMGVGLLLTVAATGALRAQLFEVEPTDPLTLAATVALLLGVAGAAAYLPAARAARASPLASLRTE